MEEILQGIIRKLTLKNMTIATMESCTGGALVNAITNIEGASNVLKFSAITYSNEYKIKMGVSEKIIDKYTVYSMETADAMSKNISFFTNSDYGVGITGKLKVEDISNPYGLDNLVYISIYDKEKDTYYHEEVKVTKDARVENKALVVGEVINMLDKIIKSLG